MVYRCFSAEASINVETLICVVFRLRLGLFRFWSRVLLLLPVHPHSVVARSSKNLGLLAHCSHLFVFCIRLPAISLLLLYYSSLGHPCFIHSNHVPQPTNLLLSITAATEGVSYNSVSCCFWFSKLLAGRLGGLSLLVPGPALSGSNVT